MVVLRLVAVTSPATDAGKTFVAVGIAEAAASRGVKSLFLELDLAVGDCLRVFGLLDEAARPHPTVSSLRDFSDPWAACLRSPAGVFVVPRPESPLDVASVDAVFSLLRTAQAAGFELAVADLGSDHRSPHWQRLIPEADLAVLVLDRDEKALLRVRDFFSSLQLSPKGGWVIVLNSRLPRSERRFGESVWLLRNTPQYVLSVVKVPYYSAAEQRHPKTFPPNSKEAGELLNLVFGSSIGECESDRGEEEGGLGLKMGLFKRLFGKIRGSRRSTVAGEESSFTDLAVEVQRQEAERPASYAPVPAVERKAPPIEMRPEKRPVILLLGQSSSALKKAVEEQGWEVVFNPGAFCDAVVADAEYAENLPVSCKGKPVLLVGAGLGGWFSFSEDNVVPVADLSAAVEFLVKLFGKPLSGEVGPEVTEEGIVHFSASLRERRSGKILAFYSGAQGYQGKTALAVNTAALLVEKKYSVCIIDLDTDKAGLSLLCGYSEMSPPSSDLKSLVEGKSSPVRGPGGADLVPAPLDAPGWFPNPRQISEVLSMLSIQYDYTVLDFGAKVASPPVIAALKMCDVVFVVSTPFRTALSAVARFRGRELIEVGGERVRAVINRVGARGSISPRDAARLLGLGDKFLTVPEDPSLPEAEERAFRGGCYNPPALNKRSSIRPALLQVLREIETVVGKAREAEGNC